MTTPKHLAPGTRVVIDVSRMDTIPLKAQIHARPARVIRYATPEIAARQVWTDETYAVCIDGETAERMIDRASLVEVTWDA